MNATQPTQIQKNTPSFLLARNSVSTSRTVMGDPPSRAACSTRCLLPAADSTRSGTGDPRVKDRVEEIHEEVDHHVYEGDDERHSLDRQVVALVDRVDELVADPVQAEEVLDDEGSGYEGADVETRRGEHGERRRPQSVSHHYVARRQALRLRHGDEVLLQGAYEVATQQAEIDRYGPER